MTSRKIAVVTGSRADFSHLTGVLSAIRNDKDLELQLIATGSHLSKKHGFTIDEILAQGFQVHTRIDMMLEGSSPADICHSMSVLLDKISHYFKENKPDCLVVLGDRYELLPIASAAVIHQIPIVHIHGGEATEGLIDDAVRHSVTKMAQLHLVATEPYRHRVIQMGESPDRVFNFGAPGLDNLKNLKLKSKTQLEQDLNISFRPQNILLTYHPITLSEEKTKSEIDALLNEIAALDLQKVGVFITLPNADTYNSIVHERLNVFLSSHALAKGYSNLGYVNYLSMLKNVNLVVGNSSSGIIEAPFFGKAVINLGIRQKGRITSEHIINVDEDHARLHLAFEKGLSRSFQDRVAMIPSAYGDGNACAKTVDLLKNTDFKNLKFKKFFDINF